jgi:hypothetical protein
MLKCVISSEPSQPGDWCGTYHEVNCLNLSTTVDDSLFEDVSQQTLLTSSYVTWVNSLSFHEPPALYPCFYYNHKVLSRPPA